jgi:hypothetical protein
MVETRFRNVGIGGFILLSCVFYALQKDILQFDLWQHLSCGRQIVQSGQQIYRDTFSHTIEGRPVTNQNWLAQVLFYLIYRGAGEKGLILAVGSLYALVFVTIGYCSFRRSNHIAASSICVALAVFMSFENLCIRPQVFSLLFFSVELLVLWELADRAKPPAVAAIVIAWTNCHGAFVLGIVLPAVFLCGEIVKCGGWRAAAASPRARAYCACVVAALVASFINPQPWHTLDYVTQSAAIGVQRGIVEWRPVQMGSVTGIAFAGSFVLAFVVFNRSRMRIDVTDVLLCAVFVLMGHKALRLVAFWGLVAAPILAVHLATLLKDVDSRQLRLVPVLVHVAVVILTLMVVHPALAKRFPLLIGDEEPRGLAEFIKGSQQPLGNAYNVMEWGGYLMWNGENKLKVFMDGRIDPFPQNVYEDYMAVHRGRRDWEEVLDRYQVDTIIASRALDDRLLKFCTASPNWTEAYSDRLTVVLQRANRAASPH